MSSATRRGRTGPIASPRPYPGPQARAVIERMRAVEGAGPRTGGRRSAARRRVGARLDPHRPRRQPVRGPRRQLRGGDDRPLAPRGRRRGSRPGRARQPRLVGRRPARPRVAFEEALVDIAPPGLDRVLLGPERIGRQRHGRQAGPHADRPPRGDRLLRRLPRPSQRRHRAQRQVALPRRVGHRRRTPTSCRIPYPYRWPLGAEADAGAGRARARPPRHRGPGVGRRRCRRPSSSSRSRATAASSSRPTASSPACASWRRATASSSSSTRSSAGSGGPGRTWAVGTLGRRARPDDRRARASVAGWRSRRSSAVRRSCRTGRRARTPRRSWPTR